MSESGNIYYQKGNIGIVQAANYGDNVFYSAGAEMRKKHIAQKTHNANKIEWEKSKTCEWLVEEGKFREWSKTETSSSVLWVHGRPGCGKTVLMSRVIESIHSKHAEKVQLLYFYVGNSHNENNDKMYRQMLLTFWEQAVGRSDEQSTNIWGDDSPIEYLEQGIQKLLKDSTNTRYIVIDALDQLPSRFQDRLLDWLKTLMQKCDLSLAISCRNSHQIRELQAKTYSVEVTTDRNRDDINKYLEKSLHSEFLDHNLELRKNVLNKLSEKADGMFLWVRLQALNICNMRTKSQVGMALESLVPPQEINKMFEAYADGFEKESDDPFQQRVCQRLMALLSHSTAPMPKRTVFIALSLNDHGDVDDSHYEDLADNAKLIPSFCKHLVELNEDLDVFQFCHKTVVDFFRKYKPTIYHRRIATLCLSYLSSSKFSSGPQKGVTWYDQGTLESILQKHAFLSFSSSHWFRSLKQSIDNKNDPENETVFNLFKVLFNKDGKAGERGNLQLAFQVHLITQGKAIPEGLSHEHIVGYFALVSFFDIINEKSWFDADKPDAKGMRPIHWAIRNDIDQADVTAFVNKMKLSGADINVQDDSGCTPLYYAAHCGNAEVVTLLIDLKAELDVKNKHNETALVAACKKHHEDVVLNLVKAKADVRVQSEFGTALQAISLVGCKRCAEKILERYGRSRIRETCGPFGTSLHAAAFHGHSDLVKLLCAHRTDVNASDRTYGSPLTAAASGLNPGQEPSRYLEISRELIKRGVDINDRSGRLGPALRSAAYHGNSDLVQLLLNEGAKVSKSKGIMGTAYEAAHARGHEKVMEMLLEADPSAKEYGENDVAAAHDRQKVQRRIFRATVKASSVNATNNLIREFENFFHKEIRKGATPFLKGLSKLGENCFIDVVSLTTGSAEQPNKEAGQQGKRSSFHGLSLLNCFGRENPSEPEAERDGRPRLVLRRATKTFAADGVGEHFQQVLDRMTQAAVKILEDAIENGTKEVIRLIANTWVEALNNLILRPGYGENMLKVVVQRRANELKGYMSNDDLSPEEKWEKAKALALVGIELLIVAVGRGEKFKRLSFVTSKLWVQAVIDVDSLGKDGASATQQLMGVFAERFLSAIEVKDLAEVEVCGKSGIELLRAATLSGNKSVLNKFSDEWIRCWEFALQNMDFETEQMVLRRVMEHGECCIDDEVSEGTVTAVELLQTAVKHWESRTVSRSISSV
ncbi:ankyrin repeat [Fusarium sporotrichioides]|uniref:Ankyrin repeat n=1 Tax=Fusarium sporotrichioides TaxID=5514 RepID=A0A395SC86_FUSSP|nr:ankyrin repeat [Fusarium sporotrichioides]